MSLPLDSIYDKTEGDAIQPNLTPSGVVKYSQQTAFNLAMWNLALIIFIGIILVGLFYILA